MTIKGKIVYVNLNAGFWGIESHDGKEYLPINMPEQLKKVGAKVEVRAHKVDIMTMNMWGETIEITGFQTLMP